MPCTCKCYQKEGSQEGQLQPDGRILTSRPPSYSARTQSRMSPLVLSVLILSTLNACPWSAWSAMYTCLCLLWIHLQPLYWLDPGMTYFPLTPSWIYNVSLQGQMLKLVKNYTWRHVLHLTQTLVLSCYPLLCPPQQVCLSSFSWTSATYFPVLQGLLLYTC